MNSPLSPKTSQYIQGLFKAGYDNFRNTLSAVESKLCQQRYSLEQDIKTKRKECPINDIRALFINPLEALGNIFIASISEAQPKKEKIHIESISKEDIERNFVQVLEDFFAENINYITSVLRANNIDEIPEQVMITLGELIGSANELKDQALEQFMAQVSKGVQEKKLALDNLIGKL